ncbi:nidogen-like [Anopheles coustani]|nr:nidogen-like [Anopheles coustani]
MDSRSKQIRTIVSDVTDTYYLAATNEIIFWSNYGSDTIESINQDGVRRKALSKPNNATEYESSQLIPVADVCPLFYSPCAVENGGCPENSICLPNPRAQSGKICKSTIS